MSLRVPEAFAASAATALISLLTAVSLGACLSINEEFQLEETPSPLPPGDRGVNESATSSSGATTSTDSRPQSSEATSSSTTKTPPSSGSNSTTQSTQSHSIVPSTSSADPSSSLTSSSGSSSTTGQSCDKPVICYSVNADEIANLLGFTPFAVYASRFPKDNFPLRVARVEYYTGTSTDRHVIQVHDEINANPGSVLQTQFFQGRFISGWNGTDIDPPIEMTQESPRWISWHPPTGSIGSSTLFGTPDAGRERILPSSNWSSRSYRIMMRLYCCP